MNILVTGGAGFIGSNFILWFLKKYKTQHNIINLDKLTYAGNLENLKSVKNSHYYFIKGDINNRELVEYIFKEYHITHIINFAAESHVDRSILNPQIFLTTNILGTETLLSVAKSQWRGKDHKFLQVSTDEVYGSLDETGFFTEQTPINPHSPYSSSKTSADLIVQAYHDTYGLPMNITRCSNNYGAYQFPEKLIPLIIHHALNHKKLPVYGDGKNVRDWLYVEDHCSAIDLVLQKGQNGEIYNVGGHNEKQNIEIVKIIIKELHSITGDKKINEHLIEFVKDRLGHDRRYAIDASKIQKELGWQPQIMFDKGIKKTIKWYLKNQKWVENVMDGSYREYYYKNYNK